MPSVGPLGHAVRIIAAAWCLPSVVFIYLYSGCLTSFITIPKLYPLIESLDDLATSADLKLTILKDTVFETMILVRNEFFVLHCVKSGFISKNSIFIRKQHRVVSKC
jgi:hypothetical protein